MSANAFSCDTKPFNGCTDGDAEILNIESKLKSLKSQNEGWRMNDEGGVFLTNGLTDICDCIVTFATENEVLTQFMTTILLMSKNQ